MYAYIIEDSLNRYSKFATLWKFTILPSDFESCSLKNMVHACHKQFSADILQENENNELCIS